MSEFIGQSSSGQFVKNLIDFINKHKVDFKLVLLLIFLKRVNDLWRVEFERAYAEALEDGLSKEEAEREAKSSAYHEIDLPEDLTWDKIRENTIVIPELLDRCLRAIEDNNSGFEGLSNIINFRTYAENQGNLDILRTLIEMLSDCDFSNPEYANEVFEAVIMNFGLREAKEGSIYTPKEVVELLFHILEPKPDESVYNPSCGFCEILAYFHKFARTMYGNEVRRIFLFGEEGNSYENYVLGKINLYLNGIRDFKIEFSNALLYPKFKSEDGLIGFDVVVANPQWNQDGYNENTLKKGEFWKERFKFGFPPKNSADWAWIQHMIASAKDDTGRVGVVIDNGALFRSNSKSEKSIRQKILEEDLIECVILLPEKVFYTNSGSSGAIIIFNKNKPEDRKDKVLFINASNEYEQHPEIKKLRKLSKDGVSKIVEAYQNFLEIKDFSRVVAKDEIKENDYNMNVTLYVFPTVEEEIIDVKKELEELIAIDEELSTLNERLIEEVSNIYEVDKDV